MEYIGWKLPEHAEGQQCTEDVEVFSSKMAGTFRMPRAEARPWLASLPGEWGRPPSEAEADRVTAYESGLHLSVLHPRHPQVDEARVTVRFEDHDTALVTFDTFDY